MLRKFTVLAVFTSLLAAAVPAASASSERVASYIVVLEDSVDDPRAVAREHARSHNARIGYVYEHALKGYSATMSDVAATRIAGDRRVDYVEADGIAHKVVTQESATWGLDRIDQRALPLSTTYTYDATGLGVRAYIIDTGIRVTHPLFEGRAVSGTDTVDGDSDSDDCDGHGTHVAGTVGSSTYGVAKQATLVGVRVLNCNGSGTWSGVIAGVDWVTANHVKPAVANMSLGGGYNSALNDAVEGSIGQGVVYAVAAGNGNQGGKAQDACDYSPASAPNALTVGATNSSDSKASWSNYGTCLDLFAPGVSITSTTMDGGTATWSGTSMATPHVAGVAALYLQGSPGATAATVNGAITGSATPDVVSNAGSGSPNLLLYSLLTTAEPAPAQAPVANADSATAVTGETVTIDVLANDTDANNDTLTVTELTQPASGGGSTSYSGGNTAVVYTAPATTGTYTFTYKAYDGALTSESATVSVTVTEPPPPPAGATTATIGYSTNGGKLADKHVVVRAVLTDAGGNVVPNTAIEVHISLDGVHRWTGTGTTLGDGSVSWEIKNAPSGTYTTAVAKVAGETWTGTTQDGATNTGFTKT